MTHHERPMYIERGYVNERLKRLGINSLPLRITAATALPPPPPLSRARAALIRVSHERRTTLRFVNWDKKFWCPNWNTPRPVLGPLSPYTLSCTIWFVQRMNWFATGVFGTDFAISYAWETEMIHTSKPTLRLQTLNGRYIWKYNAAFLNWVGVNLVRDPYNFREILNV